MYCSLFVLIRSLPVSIPEDRETFSGTCSSSLTPLMLKTFFTPEDVPSTHCFIFENNVVQPFATLGNNVVLWSGNHLGHHSVVGNNVFIASHVVVSGHCKIGDNCFFGVNSTLANNVTIGADCWIGPGVTIVKDIGENLFYKQDKLAPAKVTPRTYFKVEQSA